MTRLILVSIIICTSLALFAQENDTIDLDEILVTDKIPKFIIDVGWCPYPAEVTSKDIKVLPKRDINTTSNNLSDYLQEQNLLFLRTYGLGSLSTPSTSGTNANHTTVLWNGINLQSPMNGTLDFALVPALMLDDIGLDKNGGSARYGSGAIGGSLSLNNPVYFRKGMDGDLKIQGGSFQDVAPSARVRWSNGKWYNQSRAFYHSAENNFQYRNKNRFGEPIVEQSNASLAQYGFLQENALRINKKQRIDAKIWHQTNHREIPPSSLQASSVAFQDDKFTRSMLHWQYLDKKTAWHFTTAYFDEYLRYSDASIALDDTSRSQSWINQLEAFLYFKRQHQIKIGANYSLFKAFSEGYGETHFRNQIALYGDYQWHSKDWTKIVNIAIRQEIVDGEWQPLVASLNGSKAIEKWNRKNWKWHLQANIHRSYRLPTFNDLYWAVGGNPDLKAEKGWSEMVGINTASNFRNKEALYHFSIHIFNKNITNMIVWTPANNGIWSPSNVAEIWARGLNASFSVKNVSFFKKSTLNIFGNYELTRSTHRKTVNPNAVNKQLIYIPVHRANAQLEMIYKNFSLRYIQNYMSRRFTTTDNTRAIDGFWIGNVSFSYKYPAKTPIQFFAKANNIWNVDYEIVESRPMPQRYFQMGISLFFNKN